MDDRGAPVKTYVRRNVGQLEWLLLAVNPKGAQPGSAEAALVSIPTLSAKSPMRRSDRAVTSMTRHTPGLIWGIMRLAPSGGGS